MKSEDVLFSVLISGTGFYSFLFETSLPNILVIKTGRQHSVNLSHVMGGYLTWGSRPSLLCVCVCVCVCACVCVCECEIAGEPHTRSLSAVNILKQ